MVNPPARLPEIFHAVAAVLVLIEFVRPPRRAVSQTLRLPFRVSYVPAEFYPPGMGWQAILFPAVAIPSGWW